MSIGTDEVDLRVEIAGVHLPTPVMTASGCAGWGRELHPFVDVASLGAFVTPSVTRDPRAGSSPPRMVRTAGGIVVANGTPGPGLDSFLARDLPWLVQQGARTVVSIAGSTLGEFAELARRIGNAPGLSAIEVDLAGADVEHGGAVFGAGPSACARVLEQVRTGIAPDLPVFAKLVPEVADLVVVADAAVASGADGLTLLHAPRAAAVDPATLTHATDRGTARISGPATHGSALRAVWEVRAAMPGVPLLAVGGVRDGFDALALLAAGANAVQVGSVTLADPSAPARVADQLREELAARGLTTIEEARSLAHE